MDKYVCYNCTNAVVGSATTRLICLREAQREAVILKSYGQNGLKIYRIDKSLTEIIEIKWKKETQLEQIGNFFNI